MTNTKRLIQPFLDGYIDNATVEANILDGALFSVTPRNGNVSYVLCRIFC